MKSLKNVWPKIVDLENIKAAIHEAAKGKTLRADVSAVLADIDTHAAIVRDMLENLAPPDVTVEDRAKAWRPRKHRPRPRWDHNSQKWRWIIKPDYCYEQIIHHAVMRQVSPFILRSMYTYNCGSVPGRGPAYGKRALYHWISTDPKNTKYCAKLDIRHFYDSVNHDVVKRFLQQRIKDRRVLFLLFYIVDQVESGLPLGFYTSQWLANWLLEPLDYFIKQELRVPYDLRYLDDITLLGPNKKELHRAVERIQEYLGTRLGLELKANWQVFRLEYTDRRGRVRGRALDMMGFEFHRDRVVLRRRLMLKITRKARRIGKMPKLTAHAAASMISYAGWIQQAAAYGMYLAHVKPYVNIQRCKRLVAIRDRLRKKKRRKGNTKP